MLSARGQRPACARQSVARSLVHAAREAVLEEVRQGLRHDVELRVQPACGGVRGGRARGLQRTHPFLEAQ